MPSKNMIRKGKRRQTVKPAYRLHREAQREAQEQADREADRAAFGLGAGENGLTASPEGRLDERGRGTPEPAVLSPEQVVVESVAGVRSFQVGAAGRGKRLDAYLAQVLPEISRARAQLLIDDGQVRVGGVAAKASLKLEGGEVVEVAGDPQPPPLRAEPEDIPLTIVYEDDDLAVIDKPAGMTVHAGAGDAEHNRGTLVNALLFHFGNRLSTGTGGAAGVPRPGIVHRLDKETSGLILVAKNDAAHRSLAELFATRELKKTYLALVHGLVERDEGTVDLPIGRDPVHRTRMSAGRTLEQGARSAVSHWRVLKRIGGGDGEAPWGPFTLVEVGIETGRTHQIRVHFAALGHPVAGDTLYGAPRFLRRPGAGTQTKAHGRQNTPEPTLARNFLHAAELALGHPRTGAPLSFRSALPAELQAFLGKVQEERNG